MAAFLLMALGPLAAAHDVPGSEAHYELGDGLRFDFDGGRHTFHLGGFVQPAWEGTFVPDGFEQVLVARRTQFQIDGTLENERIHFEVLTDFSLQQALLNAWVGIQIADRVLVSVGQKPNPANLREMVFNEGYLSFPERSLASRTFSVTGREFGAFVDADLPLGPVVVRPSLSLTSGDGRNSFGVDSRDVDLGAFKWGGRLDVYPLGDFSDGNHDTVTDLVHEPSPRLVVGGAVSVNDGASGPNGEGHGEFTLFDAEGNPQQPDYTKIHADLLFKWQGVSVLGEYVQTSASGLQDTFTDPVGGNPLFSSQISEFLALGRAINAQAGYHFRFGLGVDLRYTMLMDEFDENANSIVRDTSVAGAVVTGFFLDHDFKVQLAGSRVQVGADEPFVVGELLGHLRF